MTDFLGLGPSLTFPVRQPALHVAAGSAVITLAPHASKAFLLPVPLLFLLPWILLP